MGAPDQACGAMFPGHQFDAQDNAKVPVTFTVTPEGPVAPGQSVTIELKAKEEGVAFKGYMVQASLSNQEEWTKTGGKLSKCR